MRLVVWNCNMALHRKLEALESLRPDVAVICECAKPEIVRQKSKSPMPDSVVWVGDNPNKGLAVFGTGRWRVRLDEGFDPSIRHIAPVHVDGPRPFSLLAAWAFAGRENLDAMRRGPIARGLERFKDFRSGAPLVVAGDFNNNANWNNPSNPSHRHLADVAELAQRGLFSVYHHHRGAAQGEEPEPTLYWRDRRVDGPAYHIDYIFAPENWKRELRSVEVGDFPSWVGSGLSDHVPLVAEFEFGSDPGVVRGDAGDRA